MKNKYEVDFKGLSYDDSHIQSIFGSEMCVAHKSEIDLACTWLEAALNCKSFHWDVDQAEAARESVQYLKWLVGDEY